jgi:hypothetical protein
MKKLILTLILAFLICGQAFAAVVSKSFTATGAGDSLSIKNGDSFTYAVSGTFVGTWFLQSSPDGVSTWQTVASGTAASSGTVIADSLVSDHLSYRMYCEAYTSGTIVTTMTDEVGYNVPVTEFKNKNGVTVAHTTENGFVVDGSFTGGTEDGSVTYNVKSQFGAKGNGVTLFDGAVTTATTAFTSATAAFTADDVGKVITIINAGTVSASTTRTDGAVSASSTSFTATGASFTVNDTKKLIAINGAGVAGATLYTRIASYTSATAVTLLDGANTTVSGTASFTYGNPADLTTTISAVISSTSITLGEAAGNTVSNVKYTYGTDDTTAIQSAVNAVFASNPPSGIVFFPSGIYIVNGAFTAGSNTSQIGLPDIPLTDDSANKEATIVFEGPLNQKNPNTYRSGESGAIIYSTRNGTVGTQSILSGKSPSSSGSLTDIFIQLRNITFRTVQNPKNSALLLQFINSCAGDGVLIDTAGLMNLEYAIPQNSDSYGIKTCGELNNNSNNWDRLRVRGFYNGIWAGEHMTLGYGFVLKAINGLIVPTMTHDILIDYIGLEMAQNNIVCAGTGQLTINMADIEHNSTNNWWTTVLDIKDTSNTCTGTVNYDIIGTGGAGATIVLDGARKISTHSITGEVFRVGGTSSFRVENGTSSPSTTSGGFITLAQDNGTAVSSGHRIGGLFFSGAYDTSNSIVAGARIDALAAQNFTSASAAGTDLRFSTLPTSSSTLTERIRITANGNVGIGTSTPTALLQVGTAAATAFQISTSGGITSAGNVGISTVAPTSCLCKTYTNGICTLLASCI